MRISEYGSLTTHLSEQEVAHLVRFAGVGDTNDRRLLRQITPTRIPGEHELVAGGYVGRLALPSGRTIDFTSRFRIKELVWLIALSNRPAIQPDRLLAYQAETGELTSTIALAFIREVEALTGRGLAKRYESRRFTAPPYPGRLDASYHLSRLAGRPDRIATSAKRLTTDTPVNQVVAVALDVLRRTTGLVGPVLSEVHRLAHMLRHISRPPMTASDIAGIRLDRLTDRYRPALGLAALILRMSALSPLSGGQSGTSLLFYMPDIWEDFVARWVEHHAPPSCTVDAAHRFDVTNDGSVSGVADVLVSRNGAALALFDAKYKWPAKAPVASDLFQMIAYCDRLGLDHATLVYPVATSRRTVRVGRKSVTVVGLLPDPVEFDGTVPPGLSAPSQTTIRPAKAGDARPS